MKYYSTNKQASEVTLEEAVVKGLAADKGLFMPFTIKTLPQEFYDSIDTLSFQEIAYRVADAFFGEDVPADTLKQIVYDTLSFDVPLVRVTENIYSLELFHGPTLAFPTKNSTLSILFNSAFLLASSMASLMISTP